MQQPQRILTTSPPTLPPRKHNYNTSICPTSQELKNDEIRLITLITDRSDPEFMEDVVSCKLERFSLSENEKTQEAKQGKRVKGWSRVWDRDVGNIELEENLLLRKSSKKEMQGTDRSHTIYPSSISMTPGNIFEEDLDNTLPWRYNWGDYIALSYLWGREDPNTDVRVLINGQEVLIRENLAAALMQLRECPRIKQGFKIWVDMICIDQMNISEREAQIGKMKDIYASAWHVVVWLGVEANESNIAMSAIRYLARRHRSAASSTHPDLISPPGWGIVTSVRYTSFKNSVHIHLYRFLTRDYWYRLWILQEIALGTQDLPILCGDSYVKWSDIIDATTLIRQNEMGFWLATDWALFFERKGLIHGEYKHIDRLKARMTRASVRNRDWCPPEWRKFADLAELQRNQSSPRRGKGNADTDTNEIFDGQQSENASSDHPWTYGQDESFWKALLLGRSASVTNPCDKIYGLLGLSGLSSLGITVNYNLSPEQVFILFARCMITKSHSLSLFRFASNPVGEIIRQPSDKQTLLYRPVERYNILPGCGHTDLPSWAPCWICSSGASWDTTGYDAGLSLPLTPDFKSEVTKDGKKREILILQGIIFDHIENISAFHAFEADEGFPYNVPLQPSSERPQKRAAESVYPSLSEALWRTLVGNRSSTGSSPAPESYSCLLSPQAFESWQNEFMASDIEYWLGKTLTQFRTRNKTLDIFGTKLGDLLPGFGINLINLV